MGVRYATHSLSVWKTQSAGLNPENQHATEFDVHHDSKTDFWEIWIWWQNDTSPDFWEEETFESSLCEKNQIFSIVVSNSRFSVVSLVIVYKKFSNELTFQTFFPRKSTRLVSILNNRYGVALVGRIDKIVGLFCKRALLKRLYSAKETYNFI